MLLQHKTALITGCNRGIGKAVLEIFAENGADIFACIRKESDEFSDVTARLAEKTGVPLLRFILILQKANRLKPESKP